MTYPNGLAEHYRASDLERIYSKYLRHICGVKYATPSAMLLERIEPVTIAGLLVAAESFSTSLLLAPCDTHVPLSVPLFLHC